MSETQEIDSPIATSEGNINNSNSTSTPDEGETMKTLSNEEDDEIKKSESIEEPKNRVAKHKDIEAVPSDDTTKVESKSSKRDESVVTAEPPTSPMTNTLDRNKAGECNLLPVLVERLRSALEQSCSSPSGVASEAIRPEDSGIDSEEELRVWASGLCNSTEQQRDRLSSNDLQSPRGLKLDLKFLEDLLLSDIRTALGRLQETLVRVDIGTLTRYNSTLDPTNKLNLLKLISSLLASLKIPEGSVAMPEKSSKSSSSGGARRRRADRHTIAITSEELARARKWLEDKSSVATVPGPTSDVVRSQLEIETGRNLESDNRREPIGNVDKENPIDRLERDDKQYATVPEKHMKDALNQQQSLQNKSGRDTSRETVYQEPSGNIISGGKLADLPYRDDNTIINEEYGLSASSLYNRSNAQTKCNKYMAKKSKIKRANTIDIPNYLKLQAESLTNGNGTGLLRRPINIGDKYSYNGGHVVPSFEPKTENDRKFLALINKNNDAATLTATSSLPFKSFNYRQIASDADKNWNSRFSNIKTTFDKRPSGPEENIGNKPTDVLVGSLRLPYKQRSPGFSHAPTSPFRKIEKPSRDETIPGFLKAGYLPKNGSALRAKVKIFDQENGESTVSPNLSPLPARTAKHRSNAKRMPNFLNDADQHGPNDNGNLNYHTFCKQFAPFVAKNPTDPPKSAPWSNDSGNAEKTRLRDRAREKFKLAEERTSSRDVYAIDRKVPTAYGSADHCENARQDKPGNRKLYESYDARPNENGTNSRDIVAYPFEVNYHKRGSFDEKYRDATSEKADFAEDAQQQGRSSPLSTLQYIRSILPSTTTTPSPPSRDNSSTQNVAVQTHRADTFCPIYTSDNLVNYPARDESSILRRLVHPSPSPNEIAPRQTRNSTREEARRNSDHQDDTRTDPSRQYRDNNQLSSCQRDPDSGPFTYRTTNPTQGRQTLPQNPPGHVPHPANRYPPITDHESHYYPEIEQPPPIPAPPQIGTPSISKLERQRDDRYQQYEGRSYEENNRPLRNYHSYGDTDFCREAKNPINVPSDRNIEVDPREIHDNSSLDQLAGTLAGPSSNSNPVDNYSHEGTRSYGDDAEDENIQNQDISTTEGVVTRYACAIATVSPVPESPTISSSPSTLKDPRDTESSKILDENSQSDQPPGHPQISYVATPFYRDERAHEREETSLDRVMRHNLLQQNLIRQLQRDQSEVSSPSRRLSQPPYGEDPTNKFRYPIKSDVDQLPTVPRKVFQTSCVNEAMRGVLGHPTQSTDQSNNNVETVIESNNTQDKINIFEERNNSMKSHHQRFKPLNIPHRDRGTFVTPKINVVSPSKVFKPSFKGEADARAPNIGTIELPRKIPSNVDSSDEYLMSCASKPSRSIVLSKSESWHQLAFSKSTLQVPQAKPCALLKPPKPKSPSSLKLSKQYEASSSSDAIRKMEEKIQRYFQGPGPTGQTDSSVLPQKDTKTKRNFNPRKSQGSLMRSHTMPHIYDDTTDVDKAFDSLFKEATRSDNRC